MNFINPLFYTRIFSVGAVLAAFLACFFCNARAQLAAPVSEHPLELSVSEQRFLKQLVNETAHQMHLAKLATQRATSPAVRDYAQQVLSASTGLNQEAGALLTNNHLQDARVASAGAEAKECRDLAAAHDAEFEAAFMRVMVRKQTLLAQQLNVAAEEREAHGVRPVVNAYLAKFDRLVAEADELVQRPSAVLVAGS